VFIDGGLPITPTVESGRIDILEPTFVRGDTNGDEALDISDGIALAAALFTGGPGPPCDDAADGNDDGVLDVADVVTVLHHLFAGGPPLPPPGTGCGEDPTADPLGCDRPVVCP